MNRTATERQSMMAPHLRCVHLVLLFLFGIISAHTLRAAGVTENVTFTGQHQDFGLDITASGSLTVSGTARIHVDVPLFGDTHADVTIPLQTIPFSLSPNPLNLVSDPSGSATVGYDDVDLSGATLSDLNVDFRNGTAWNFGVTPIVAQANVNFGILPSFGVDLIFDIGASLSTFDFAGSGPATVTPSGGSFPSQQYFFAQPGTLTAAITGGVNARVETGLFNTNLGQVASLNLTSTDTGFVLPGGMTLTAANGPPATVVDTQLGLSVPFSLPFSISDAGSIITNDPHGNGSLDTNINYSLSGDFTLGNLDYSLDSGPPGPRTDSMLYGGNAGRFFSIDPSDGSTTNISTSGFSIESMAFDPTGGVLYGGGISGRFFSIDPSDGSQTNISTGGFSIEGLAFEPVPEPSSLILASLGALSLAGFGRRRRRQTTK